MPLSIRLAVHARPVCPRVTTFGLPPPTHRLTAFASRRHAMRTWLFRHWDALRTNYWFIPALMAITAVVLAFATTELDREVISWSSGRWTWTYGGGPEGARAVLSTIAGSMITVAGVVFSITIVALSLASGQFGPRLLRGFIRDRSNQFVLGTFTSTFIYCLLILRTVRGTDDDRFVPGLSVTVGIVLAILNLGVLIYFIHHVAFSIQATQIIAVVNGELWETIDRLWPDDVGEEPAKSDDQTHSDAAVPDWDESVVLTAKESGYVDAIEDESLIELAKDRDLVLKLERRPGHFIVKGSPLALAWPRDRVDDEVTTKLNRLCTLSSSRTPYQDVEFAIDQLVEIAVRALSPGINDPFTAMACIDHLAESLCRLAQRPVPSPFRYDDEKKLRVITFGSSFAKILDAAFHQIRQYGRSSAAVLIRLLEMLAVLANYVECDEDRCALAKHADLIRRAADQGLPEEADRLDVEERFAALKSALKAHS